MRPITKIFLFLVAAFVVYLLWPRTPDLRAFDPGALARLKCQVWQAQKANGGYSALVARFQAYSSQYGFSPITAFQLAQIDGDVMASLKTARGENAEANEENRVLNLLVQKYSMMKPASKQEIAPDALAREELLWRTLLLDGKPVNQVAVPLANILAAFYGGQPKDFEVVAGDISAAQAAALGVTESPAVNEAGGPQATLREAYRLLKEIAVTPAPAPGGNG